MECYPCITKQMDILIGIETLICLFLPLCTKEVNSNRKKFHPPVETPYFKLGYFLYVRRLG